MKKALFLATIFFMCTFVPLTVSETADDSDGAEIGVWYYLVGYAPSNTDIKSVFKLVRMDSVETPWPNCEFILTDVPEHPELENFTFSHWSIWVHTSYDTYKLGDYTDDEIRTLTVSYSPEKPYEVPYVFYVKAIYLYSPSVSWLEQSLPFLTCAGLFIALICIAFITLRHYGKINL